MTDGQAGVPGTDDNRVNSTGRLAVTRSGHPVEFTSTVTLVGLVTMSNTAERFCD